MRRREAIGILAGAALAPRLLRAASAQQPARAPLIGVLMSWAETDADAQGWLRAFVAELHNLGWRDRINLRIDIRWGSGDRVRMRANAAEIVRLKPDVILANTAPGVAALRDESRTIPTVFTQIVDPIGGGFVASLARPGGTLTGFTTFETATGAKWLELLKEISPSLARTAVLLDPQAPGYEPLLRALEKAAPALGVQVVATGVGDTGEIAREIEAFTAAPNGGIIAFPTPVVVANRKQIFELADRRRVPAIYPYRYFAAAGGLMSYGPDTKDLYRRAASYVDRLLKGEAPADLPVQQPTKFELVINLKTAKVLGLDIPPTVLARADEVIE
jgi:putative ABC transport system substrate-binding protein